MVITRCSTIFSKLPYIYILKRLLYKKKFEKIYIIVIKFHLLNMSAISIRTVHKTSFYTMQYKYAMSIYYRVRNRACHTKSRLTNRQQTVYFYALSLSNWTIPMADFLKLPQLQLPAKFHHSRHPQKLASLSH